MRKRKNICIESYISLNEFNAETYFFIIAAFYKRSERLGIVIRCFNFDGY